VTSEELYAKYHRLVWRVARTMQKSYRLSEEDVEDIAAHAFQRLITLPAGKRTVAAYVRTVINNGCRTELGHVLKLRNRQEDSGNLLQVKDPRQSAEVALVNNNLVFHSISRLSPEERYIVTRLSGLLGQSPHTPHEIARQLNIPRTQIFKMIDAIYARMRSWLTSEVMESQL
jgi:RNA polymerase sigma factor (sigma-70 family)